MQPADTVLSLKPPGKHFSSALPAAKCCSIVDVHMELVMPSKQEARTSYYQGLKQAMDSHIVATEEGLRALPGVDKDKIDRILASVKKRHKKLLKRLERDATGAGIKIA